MYQQTGAIAVTTRYWWATFIFALFRPYVAIDGHQVPTTGWGRMVVPVPPGQHHVQVHVPYLIPSRVGTAGMIVQVFPGHVVELEYRAPAIGWLDGSIGPAPQKHRGQAAGIVLLILPFVMLLCICAGVGVGLINEAGEDDRPVARPPATFPTLPTLPPLPTPPARPTVPAAPEPTGTKPTLRQAPARTLVGASYAAGERTYTMDFTGWPFAFRTPGTWGCLAGKVDVPEAKAWVCVDERNPRSGQRFQIMLRPCPAECDRAERDARDTDWFDPGAQAKRHDAVTSYVEIPRNDEGRYVLDMSTYFPADQPRWQVSVGGYSPPASRAAIQKIVNDVLTQTGAQ